eukprot:12402502-Alexandrium_andersonii.AAC.1
MSQIVQTLTEDPRHIVPTFTFLSKRKRALDEDDAALDQPVFASLTTFGSIPTDTKVEWIVKHSNMDTNQ